MDFMELFLKYQKTWALVLALGIHGGVMVATAPGRSQTPPATGTGIPWENRSTTSEFQGSWSVDQDYRLNGGASLAESESPNPENISPETNPKRPDNLPPSSPLTPQSYSLGPGDRLRVELLNVPEYSGEYVVSGEGAIAFPVLGVGQVQGLTVPQLQEVLRESYGKYVRRPLVTVTLIEARSITVTVEGAIFQPGILQLDRPSAQALPRLADALQRAGGITDQGDLQRIQVIRGDQQWTVNLERFLLRSQLGENLPLQDGDLVRVPTSSPEGAPETAEDPLGNVF